MMNIFNYTLMPGVLAIFSIIAVWELIWKGIGMWKAGRNNQKAWFICILIFNTIGILPILYLLFFKKNRNPRPKPKKK